MSETTVTELLSLRFYLEYEANDNLSNLKENKVEVGDAIFFESLIHKRKQT